MAAAPTSSPPGDNVIVISRVIDAPRELVFEAFTDPTHLVQFWGPKGFTAPACEVDLRVGGAFRVEMRAPDGSDLSVLPASIARSCRRSGSSMPATAATTIRAAVACRRTRW